MEGGHVIMSLSHVKHICQLIEGLTIPVVVVGVGSSSPALIYSLSVVVFLSSCCQTPIPIDKDKIPRNPKTKATARRPKTIFLFMTEVLSISISKR